MALAMVLVALARLTARHATALGVMRKGLLPRLLTGGDDYELLVAVPPDRRDAAERAASSPGTEVGPAELRGRSHGPRGPWAMLRRRGEHEVTDV